VNVPSPLSPNTEFNARTPVTGNSGKVPPRLLKRDPTPQAIHITHTPPRSPLPSPLPETNGTARINKNDNGITLNGVSSHKSAPKSVDVASSPSSANGTYSNSTPKAAVPSPDTSPEAAPSPSSHQAEYVSKKVVDSTPEAQLRLEEAQANEAASRSSDEKSLAPTASKSAVEHPFTPIKNQESSSTIKLQSQDVEMVDAQSLDSQPVVTPGRMTTRVASGAIRQKSVSEILGETPKPGTPKSDGRPSSRKSTVVFSKDKDLASQGQRSEMDGYLALKGASLDPDKDYLRPLFLYQAYSHPRGPTLMELVSNTRKVVSTTDMTGTMRESIDQRILRKIYQLQNANKWSLRQPIKYPDPAPIHTHWDSLLEEMKWMRTDFKEELRWKQTAAANLAQWCSEYVNASDDEKAIMRVNVKSPVTDANRVIADSFDDLPELSEGGISELSEDDIHPPITVYNPPNALFSLSYDDIIFKVDDTPSAHALIGELPLYDPKSDHDPIDSALPVSRHDMLPVSKFVTGKIVPKIAGPPKKRSRYDYEETDEEYGGPAHKRARSSSSVTPFLSPARRSSPKSELPPEDAHVALFNPVNKHILQRIRTTNSFRPPSEFPMPGDPFYLHRVQSKWTWDEDQRLRHCVRQYHYNWSMISEDLQNRFQISKFVSGPERRTPWECFERWTQLEGLPNDLGRSIYFKTYQNRITDSARQAMEKQGIAANQIPAGARVKGLPPDRTNQRRDTRHITMIDAMRRLARRRENTAMRQQEGMFAPLCIEYYANIVQLLKLPLYVKLILIKVSINQTSRE
jgi:chromatin modification-related protein VID21